jgi:DNA-binding NtrC family response regulator
MAFRLLIADDEEAIRFAMKEYFEDLGYEVDCAEGGSQARLLLDAHDYRVVIADLRLGAQGIADGLDLVRGVKDRFPATRTMILTAYGSPDVEQEAERIGVDAFLHKPERLKDIAAVVRRLAEIPR